MFDENLERYNARQKRSDRKINDYFEHLFNRPPSKSVITGTNKQKSFYEHLVYIGKKDDTGVGTPDADISKECLCEYMEDFRERNPNLYVFNAVMHLDEATPHLHINYIPLGHFERGLEMRNAKAKALEEMGYGKGESANIRWREAEWKVLRDICEKQGIEISEPKKSRGYSFKSQEYGEYKDQIHALEEEKAQAEAERDEVKAELGKVAQKKVKLDDIDKLETGKTMFSGKVTVSQEDWDNITALAKREVVSTKQVKKLKKERDNAVQERDELKQKYDTASSELAAYKKKESERGMLHRSDLKSTAKRISTEDELKRKLSRAMTVIDRYELRSEYERTKFSQSKNTELE